MFSDKSWSIYINNFYLKYLYTLKFLNCGVKNGIKVAGLVLALIKVSSRWTSPGIVKGGGRLLKV